MDKLIDQKISIFETLLLEIQQKIVKLLWKFGQENDGEHLLDEKAKLIENYLIRIGNKIENGSIFDDNEYDIGPLLSPFEQKVDIRPLNLLSDSKLGQENGTTSNDIGPSALSPPPKPNDLDFSNIKIKLERIDKELIVVLERLPESKIQEYCQNARKNKKELDERNTRSTKTKTKNSWGRPLKAEHKYCCTKCTRKKYFTTQVKLKYHVQRCHTVHKDPVKCNIDSCTQQFYSFNSRLDHIRQAHTNCLQCSAKFEKRAQLVHHIKAVHGNEGMYNCTKCPKKFFFRSHQNQHFRKEHMKDVVDTSESSDTVQIQPIAMRTIEGVPRGGGFLCKFEGCTEGFVSNDDLNVHRHKIHGVEIFKCSECSRNCSTQRNLRSHYRKMHKHLRRLYCDFENCTKHFPSVKKTLFNLHKMSHTIEHLEDFVEQKTCPICKKVIENSQNLKLHIINHDKNVKYSCSVCQKNFSNSCSMRRHEKMTHSGDIKIYCEICGLSLKNQLTLISHKKSKHGPRFLCNFPLCSFTCHSQQVLDNHYEGSHKEVNLCPFCSKEFVTKRKLSSHIYMRHTRVFKCTFEQCSEVFSTEINLNKHMAEVHGQVEYQFQCCGRNCWSKDRLRTHVQRNHETSLKCSVIGCDQVFKRKYKLKSHEESHQKQS